MKNLTLAFLLLGVGFFISPVQIYAQTFPTTGYDISEYVTYDSYSSGFLYDVDVAGLYAEYGSICETLFTTNHPAGGGSKYANGYGQQWTGSAWDNPAGGWFGTSAVCGAYEFNNMSAQISVPDIDGSYLYGAQNTTGTTPSFSDLKFWVRIDVVDGVPSIVNEPPPDLSTHIVAIASPTTYEVTASTTFPVEFIWRQNYDVERANTYRITYVNYLTYQTVNTPVTWLDGGSSAGVYTQYATTTLPSGGTWKMTVSIGDGSADVADAPFYAIDTYVDHPFSVVFEDNVTTTEFGPAYAIYDESSCQLDWSLNFNVSDCAGYLFIPGKNLFAPYVTLRDQLATKFPFSYIFSIASVWESLTVSGETMPANVIEYASTTISVGDTSFGNPLPNFEFFSEETITTYLPPELLDTFRLLMAAVIWMSTFGYLFNEVRFLLRNKNV